MDPASKKRKADENGAGTAKLSPEDARKIVEAFTRDQLLDIVISAVCGGESVTVLDAVRSIADRDPNKRKLFVRGLGWDTTADSLRSIFSAFGELDEAAVPLDKATGRSKGYGFVTMRHSDGALLALKDPNKQIDGRVTITQLSGSGTSSSFATAFVPPIDPTHRKIYIGNITSDVSPESLLAHFSSYGEIEEGPLGLDKQTGKFRGYAMFVYKTVDGARASLVAPSKTIDGHNIVCKLANEGKGKPGVPIAAPAATSLPGSLPSQLGVQGSGITSSFGGYPVNGLQSEHHSINTPLQPTVSSATSVGSEVPSSLIGSGGPYVSSSQYGGPGFVGYAGSLPSQFGVHGSGLTSFGGYPGNELQGAGGLIQNHSLNTALQPTASSGTLGLSSAGGQIPPSFISSGPYVSSSQHGVPDFVGSAVSGVGSSLYRIPPGSVGLPSGSYPESGQYSLSSGYQNQHHQTAGSSPRQRFPTGGVLYPTLPPYY